MEGDELLAVGLGDLEDAVQNPQPAADVRLVEGPQNRKVGTRQEPSIVVVENERTVHVPLQIEARVSERADAESAGDRDATFDVRHERVDPDTSAQASEGDVEQR